MSYQWDIRIEKRAQARLAGCVGCRDIKHDGIRFTEHTCGQKMSRGLVRGVPTQ